MPKKNKADEVDPQIVKPGQDIRLKRLRAGYYWEFVRIGGFIEAVRCIREYRNGGKSTVWRVDRSEILTRHQTQTPWEALTQEEFPTYAAAKAWLSEDAANRHQYKLLSVLS